MSDEVKTAEPVAAPATATPATEEPNWLPARLERERKRVLAELGVEKVEDAKQAIAELKAKQDADKSELQKLLEQKAALEVQAKRASELEVAVKVHAEKALSGLTDAQRSAVKALAGEDPAKVVGAIEALKPTWTVASTPVVEPPVSTSPAAKAPPEASTSEPSHKAVYELLAKTNPIAAAEYRFKHYNAIAAEAKLNKA